MSGEVTRVQAAAELAEANRALREQERANVSEVMRAAAAPAEALGTAVKHQDGEVGRLLSAVGTAWGSAASEWPHQHLATYSEANRWGSVCAAALELARRINGGEGAVSAFYVTFGQQYHREPHPKLDQAHPDGWVTILARDEAEARDEAFHWLGRAWSFMYDEQPDPALFPRGELFRVDAS